MLRNIILLNFLYISEPYWLCLILFKAWLNFLCYILFRIFIFIIWSEFVCLVGWLFLFCVYVCPWQVLVLIMLVSEPNKQTPSCFFSVIGSSLTGISITRFVILTHPPSSFSHHSCDYYLNLLELLIIPCIKCKS